MEGEGVFIWPDNRKYKGEYKNGKKHGYGIYEWPDGRLYKGKWKDGKQEGDGEFLEAGIWKKGFWKNGELSYWLN